MSNLSPTESQSPSKENDSIDGGPRKAGPSHEDDEFEDSLNVSISEHISEEIESNYNLSSAAEDSIDRPARQFDQMVIEKKRKLFNFDDDDKSEAADNDGIRKFTKFDTGDGSFDEFLSGDNIAKHFMTESGTSATQRSGDERNQNTSQHTNSDSDVKIDVENSLSVDDGAANQTSKADDSASLKGMSNKSDKMKSDSTSKKEENNDVILINDHEISLTSLKQLQRNRSHGDSEHSAANQTNQNTTSDISDLLNEDKEQKSIEDISCISINESRPTSSKRESQNEDKSGDKSDEKTSGKSSKHSKDESDGEHQEQEPDEEMKEVENIQKCKPMSIESPTELSVIEEVSVADETSSHRNLMESNFDKRNEIRKIINETIDKLPLEKENRPPNLHDELLSTDSRNLSSSQNSTATDGTVYSAFATKPTMSFDLDPNFESELNLNLIHMQNKIKELHNLSTGKYSVLEIDLPASGRRDSLKDSQSGRESMSMTTNSTEYRPFQNEYLRVSF